MLSRRQFCKDLMLGSMFATFSPYICAAQGTADRSVVTGFGPLQPDPRKILDLAEGFSYQIITVMGQKMSDGLNVPGWPDGMHAFSSGKDRVSILCNHELDIMQQKLSAWPAGREATSNEKAMSYDLIGDKPAPGAVRRIIYNLKKQRVEKQHLALCGTLRNCSGGATPWGSWLSCEESVRVAGQSGLSRNHGYCFELPLKGDGLVKAEPLKSMGRFFREAAVVDPATGIVYMNEDRMDGLFYRFIPKVPGELAKGGRLQAMALPSSGGSVSTANHGQTRIAQGTRLAVHWVDLNDVDSPDDSLRYQGQFNDAATFARGEGLLVEAGVGSEQITMLWMVCTAGGRRGLGQIFRYMPSKYEGGFREKQAPGELELFSEPNDARLMRNGDNLVAMPNGDLLICEDHHQTQRMIGLTRRGQYYVLASNPRKASEFAGPTFSPDGTTLFINLQQQGATLAIKGPWNKPT